MWSKYINGGGKNGMATPTDSNYGALGPQVGINAQGSCHVLVTVTVFV